MRDWLLLLRAAALALAAMAAFAAVGSPLGFTWAAAAGGLAVAQRDSAYQCGIQRREDRA